MVARLLREQEVVGSSPVASTNVETRLFCKESAFLRTLFAFCRFLLLPESSLSGVPFFFKPFLLVWLFCCVRLTKKPNVALGAVWQTSFYGMLNFVTLRELSSLAAPLLPLLASPVASTNVETRLFCKESAFLRTLFAFCRFLLLPESSLSGFLFFSSPFCLFGFFVTLPSKTSKKRPRKSKKIFVPQMYPKKNLTSKTRFQR